MAKKKRAGRKKLRTRQHVIADLSVNHVERHILRCGFSVERIEHDYGVDLLMFTYAESGEIENGHVQLQLKATDRPNLLKDRKTVSLRVEYAHLFSWSCEPWPVILIVYDGINDRAYWLYVQRYLESQRESSLLVDDEQESVTLHVPMANRVNRVAVEKFRRFRDNILAQVKRVVRHDG